MKLKTTLFGNVYQFKDVKEVLAKANELRSGDVLAGVAAASSQERVAAKQVLSEMNIEFFKGFFCGKIFIFDSARMDQSMD